MKYLDEKLTPGFQNCGFSQSITRDCNFFRGQNPRQVFMEEKWSFFFSLETKIEDKIAI